MNPSLKTSLAVAGVAGVAAILAAAGGAQAGRFTAHITPPSAYDQYEAIKHPGGHVTYNPGSTVMINPQPLPPRYLVQSSLGAAHSGDQVGFNPQPDPPAAY